MKKILVYFYGYKSKSLSHAVDQLIKNQSGKNNIHVIVYDQTNVSRPEKFIDVEYNYIHWDSQMSRFNPMNLIKRRKGFDFFMYVDGSKMFEKNWDITLLQYQGQEETVLSGSHGLIFNKSNYKFYPDYKKINIATETKVNWVSKDFFFMSFATFKVLPDLSLFKYYGVEECLSMCLAHRGIDVFAIPSSMVYDPDTDITENDFIPFSLYHNYSKVIDSFKSKSGSMPGAEELMKLIDYNFSSLEYFPYDRNDVEYSYLSNLDLISEKRFHAIQNGIY